MASKIALAVTLRRQTCVPAAAVMAHVKHQPFAWNMGRVHRYTGLRGMAQSVSCSMLIR
ncbi:hypothetical protein D3C86_2055320 [compost metagenome]